MTRKSHPKRIQPGPDQESVWDYPRPPSLVSTGKHVRVKVGDHVIADTHSALRLLETSHPPTWYLPPDCIAEGALRADAKGTFCEWKGHAHYFAIVTPDQIIRAAAWSYPTPTSRYAALAGYFAFYAGRVQASVDDVLVEPQPGDFYGGWVTPDVVGPFKGEPGSWGW